MRFYRARRRGRLRRRWWRCSSGFVQQCQLRGEPVELLAGAAELGALQPRDLQLQMLDRRTQQDDFGPLRVPLRCAGADETLQFLDVIRQ